MGGHLTHTVAIATAALYVALLGCSWVMNGQAGFDGVLRPEPHDLLDSRPPVRVLEVEPGSPADGAGVRPGDLLVGVDNNPFVFDVHQTYHNRFAGTTGSLRVVSGSEPARTVELTLESRLASPTIVLEMALASLLGVATVAVGVFVALVRPRSPAARLLLMVALAVAGAAAADIWHWAQRDSWTATLLDQLSNITWMVGAAAVLHLFLVFPAPRVRYGRFRRLVPLLYAAAFIPFALGWWKQSFGVVAIVSMVVLTGLFTAALVALELSYRRPATPLARAQLGWVRWGLAVGVSATLVSRVAHLLVPDAVPALVSSVVNLAWLVFPVSIAMAVLRYRLFEVDRVVRMTIVWGLLGALLVAAYLVLAVVIGRLAAGLFGVAADPTWAVVAVLIAAAVGHPLRLRIQAALERRVYRQRFARQHLLEQATRLLSRPQSSDELARFLCQGVPRALALSHGWLAVPAQAAPRFAAEGETLFPNVSAAAPSLLAAAGSFDAPVLLAPPDDRAAYAHMPALSVDSPGVQNWYLAGARAIVPLRSASDELVALWLLGTHASGDLLDREDLAVLAQLAGLAALQLERSASVPADRSALPVLEALTEREREVMALLARGHSNRQIAEELIIGVRTAETHVERVLRKLGLDNRAQVIVWAQEHAPVESPRAS